MMKPKIFPRFSMQREQRLKILPVFHASDVINNSECVILVCCSMAGGGFEEGPVAMIVPFVFSTGVGESELSPLVELVQVNAFFHFTFWHFCFLFSNIPGPWIFAEHPNQRVLLDCVDACEGATQVELLSGGHPVLSRFGRQWIHRSLALFDGTWKL